MDSAIGRAETRPIGATKPDGVSCNPPAGAAVAVDKLGRFGRRGDDRVENPEAAEFARRIGRQSDRSADFGQLLRLLVDIGVKATLTERKPQRQAADASADD